MLIFYSSVFLFFCFSFSGWLLETVAAAVRTHRYVDRSVLFGPLCIVYGVGGLMMVHLLGELRGNWLFLFLGCGETSALHTAAFDFDERVLETGVRYFEAVAGGTVW